MRRLRILQLYSDYRWTGPAEPAVSLSKWLAKRGHELFFACVSKPDGILEQRIREAGLPIITGLRLNRYFNLFDNIHDILNLPNLLRRYRIDILHTHLSHDYLIGALGGIGSSSLLIRTLHEAIPRRRAFLERYLFRNLTDGIIAICESARESLIRRGEADPEKVRTIHGGVDIRRFNPGIKGDKIRREFGLEERIPVAGVVARFHDHGKHRYLLEAIPQVRRVLPEARFFFIGRGKYRTVLEGMAEELKVSDHAIFTGQRDEDYPEVLAAMDVKVYLTPGFDGSCRAVIEAMAMGKPVVAPPVGPLPEMIKDGRTGFLVHPEDTPSLAKAISSLLSDRERARRMGKAARDLVEERFREDIRALRTEEFYYELMSEVRGWSS